MDANAHAILGVVRGEFLPWEQTHDYRLDRVSFASRTLPTPYPSRNLVRLKYRCLLLAHVYVQRSYSTIQRIRIIHPFFRPYYCLTGYRRNR